MKNKYSFSELIKNIYSLFMTKLFFSQARFIRRPIYIRGIKSISGAKNLTTGRFCRFDLDGAKKTLFIGDNCEFGDNTHIVALDRVKIGDNVLIASKVFISDVNHGMYKGRNCDNPLVPPNKRELLSESVIIGNNVWIGENAVILAGASIGDGCIIGANSVVKGKFEKNQILVGSPAKAVKKWSEEKKTWKKNY